MIVTRAGKQLRLDGVSWLTGVRAGLPRKIVGTEWDARDQVWKFPLTTTNCRLLRRVLGIELRVDDSLSGWYRKEMEKSK